MSEKEKMLAGEMYDASDSVLVEERNAAHRACRTFNQSIEADHRNLSDLLRIFGKVGGGVYIEPPFYCDYGYNIKLGDRVYFNFNVVILDCAPVDIEDGVKFGPGVQLYTAGHNLEPTQRALGEEFALPIKICKNVWMGGASIVLPGVTIGENSVIGAGSVVTSDIPGDVIAVGNPARVIKPLKAG